MHARVRARSTHACRTRSEHAVAAPTGAQQHTIPALMEPLVLSGAHSRWVHDCCWLAAGRLAVSCGFEGVALVRVVPASATAVPTCCSVLKDESGMIPSLSEH